MALTELLRLKQEAKTEESETMISFSELSPAIESLLEVGIADFVPKSDEPLSENSTPILWEKLAEGKYLDLLFSDLGRERLALSLFHTVLFFQEQLPAFLKHVLSSEKQSKEELITRIKTWEKIWGFIADPDLTQKGIQAGAKTLSKRQTASLPLNGYHQLEISPHYQLSSELNPGYVSLENQYQLHGLHFAIAEAASPKEVKAFIDNITLQTARARLLDRRKLRRKLEEYCTESDRYPILYLHARTFNGSRPTTLSVEATKSIISDMKNLLFPHQQEFLPPISEHSSFGYFICWKDNRNQLGIELTTTDLDKEEYTLSVRLLRPEELDR